MFLDIKEIQKMSIIVINSSFKTCVELKKSDWAIGSYFSFSKAIQGEKGRAGHFVVKKKKSSTKPNSQLFF